MSCYHVSFQGCNLSYMKTGRRSRRRRRKKNTGGPGPGGGNLVTADGQCVKF